MRSGQPKRSESKEPGRARRWHPSRRAGGRWIAVALAGAVLISAILVVVSSSSSSGERHGRLEQPSAQTRRGGPQHHAAAKAALIVHRRRRPAPGSLPQTSTLPSAHTPAFKSEMSSLWQAIVTGTPRLARGAFFPEGAYRQLKEIANPAADFVGRLWRDYVLDIDAAHRLLGRGAGSAVLLGVRVPASFAHWVPPGVCYNRDGYYEVPNSRLLYRERGRVRSFGIASMISWRGVWYVVHLGAILREAEVGIVASPAEGPGVSEPSSTC